MKTVTLPFEEHEKLSRENSKMKTALMEIKESENQGMILIENTHDIQRIRVVKGGSAIKSLLKAEFEEFELNMKDLREYRIKQDRERYENLPHIKERTMEQVNSNALTKSHIAILYMVIIALIIAQIFL